jgi:hypothetical protein
MVKKLRVFIKCNLMDKQKKAFHHLIALAVTVRLATHLLTAVRYPNGWSTSFFFYYYFVVVMKTVLLKCLRLVPGWGPIDYRIYVIPTMKRLFFVVVLS